jgi:hypothetical protein
MKNNKKKSREQCCGDKKIIKRRTNVKLGSAWAGNAINQVIYRHSGLISNNKTQIAAYYLSDKIIRIVKRNLVTKRNVHYDIKGEYIIKDAHNSISIGVDKFGYYHMAYGQHATKLRYRRSLTANEVFSWTEEMGMSGLHEDCVTYPTFIAPFNDSPLIFLYRDGYHNCGSARIKKYDELTGSWKDGDHAIISGVNQKPFPCNAYWNNPVIDSEGTLHLTFVWRYSTIEKSVVHNVDICYAKSLDGGSTWRNADGQVYYLPITPDNAEVICEIPVGSNLINQCSMATDAENMPHVVYYANDITGVPQYKYMRFHQGKWRLKILSKRTRKFNIFGKGSLNLPISRPEIVIDTKNQVYILFRDDLVKCKMKIMKILDGEVMAEELISKNNIGDSEPIVDKLRWRNDKILSLLVQKTIQPNEDMNVKDAYSPIRIVDLILK